MRIYNHHLELLADIHNANPCVTKVLGGISTLTFSIPRFYYDRTTGNLIEDVRFKFLANELIVEYENDFYIIKECVLSRNEGGQIIKEVLCKHMAIELSGTKVNGLWGFSPSIESFQVPYNKPSDLVSAMQDLLFYHTCGWKLGKIPETDKKRSFNYEWQTPMQIILDLAEMFEFVPYFRVELVDGVLNKYVDFLPENYGEIKGYYRHDKNLTSIRKPIQTDGITTRLYIFGYDDITINNIETETKTVNGVEYNIHTKGKSYVDNFDYFLGLGYSYADCVNKFLKVDKITDTLYVDPNDLYDFAKKQLESVAMPVVTYEINIKDIEFYGKPEIEVGHKIRMYDSELNLDVTGIVSEIQYYENDKVNKSVTISNYYSFTGEKDVLTGAIIDQSNLSQTVIQKNKKFANTVLFNDSTGMIVQKDVSDPNADEPEYKDVVRIGQYERNKYGIQILNGKLQMDRDDGKTRILIDNESGICIYNDLNGNGVFSEDEKVFWVDTDGLLQAKKIKIFDSEWFLSNGTTVEDSFTNVYEWQGDMITVTTNMQTAIEQNAEQIALRATKEELTTVENNISAVEQRVQDAEFKLQPEQIKLTVSEWYVNKNDYTEKISGLESSITQTVEDVTFKFAQKGAYNYIQNSDFRNGDEYWSDNGGGIEVTNGVGIFTGETMCITTLPGGIKYSGWILLSANTHYVYEGWIASVDNQIEGTATTPLHFWCNRDKSTLKDGCEILDYRQECNYGEWTKVYIHFKTINSNEPIYFKPFIYGSSGRVYVKYLSLSRATTESQWTPHPSEIYDGIIRLDRDGLSVATSNSKTTTRLDHAGMEIQAANKTLAVFRENSYIPTLTADDVICPNLARKHNYASNYYVDSASGSDLNTGLSWQTAFKTVHKALQQLPDLMEHDVRIWVKSGSNIPGFNCSNKVGNGLIIIILGNSVVINGSLGFAGCNGVIVQRETTDRSPTIIGQVSLYECRLVEFHGISIDGKNSVDRGVYAERCTKVYLTTCEIRNTTESAIYNYNSILTASNIRGSGIYNYITMIQGAITVLPEEGTTTTVCNYSNNLVQRSDAGTGRLFAGGTYVKTGSGGSTPSYSGTSKTQQWSFNNYYSVENLTWGYTNTGALIQGYYSGWNTGRWTGYMNFDHGNVRSIISGGTNLSGRIYIQRLSSKHGNYTGSKIALYGSDGTAIDTSTTFDLGQGKWINLSSSVVSKIQSGAITYFYIKWDSNDASRYMRFETNAKLEITYTK